MLFNPAFLWPDKIYLLNKTVDRNTKLFFLLRRHFFQLFIYSFSCCSMQLATSWNIFVQVFNNRNFSHVPLVDA